MNVAIDPICGMTVEPESAAGKYEHDGQTYYFCSQYCAKLFGGNPAKYLKQAAPVEEASLQQTLAVDPVCGMRVDPARAAGKHEHNGTTYYFCSQHCLNKFRENPEQFFKESHQHGAHGHGSAHAAVEHV